MSKPVVTTFCLLGALFAADPAAAKEAPPAPLPLDDRIEVSETLPNGMRLWVMPHAQPKGRVGLWMHIASGSLSEDDDQRGLAHYLEHMAFNGSEHFPPGTVVDLFEALGVRFGRDQNAFTGFDQTTYTMNLPNTEAASIDKALLFLADVAFRLSLTPEEVDRERGVILEEARARSGPRMRVFERLLPLIAPGSRLAERLPIGLESIVKQLKAPDFRDYYSRWYRPDLTTMLVVGDVDPAAVAARVRAAFADWKPAEAPEPLPAAGLTPEAGLRAAVITDPELTRAEAGFGRILTRQPIRTIPDLRAQLAERLAVWIGQQRLERLAQSGDAAYQSATLRAISPFAGFKIISADVEAEPARWQKALQQLWVELRRLHAFGVLPGELDLARRDMIAAVERAAASAESLPASAWLMQLNQLVSRGDQPLSPAQRLALTKSLLPGITAEEVKAAFDGLVDLERGLLTLTLPERDGKTVTKADALATVVAANELPVTPPAAQARVAHLIEKLPPPGTVVARTPHPALGATELTLSNGARAYVRPVASAREVHVRINLYGGKVEEEAGNRGLTAVVGAALEAGRAATAEHAAEDLAAYLTGKQVSIAGSEGDAHVSLSVSGPLAEIGPGLEVAHLLLRTPRITPAAFAAARAEVRQAVEQATSTARMRVTARLRTLLGGADARMRPPTLAEIDGLTLAQAQAWAERLARTAPMEIVVSGNVEVPAAERLVLAYLGSLPPRPDRMAEIHARRKIEVADAPQVERLELDTITPMAVVLQGWRGVPSQAVAEGAALTQGAMLMSSRLLKEVREKHALTYSINASYGIREYDGLDALLIQFTGAPTEAARAAKLAREVAETFAAAGPTAAELDGLAKGVAASFATRKETAGFWTGFLSGAVLQPKGLAATATFLDAIQTVDGDAIRKALARVVVPARYLEVVGVPAPGGDGK